jgi:hypothetical protein
MRAKYIDEIRFAMNHALSRHSKYMYIEEKIYKKLTFVLCVLQLVVVPVSYVPSSRHLTASSLPMLVYMIMCIASIIIYHLPKHCNHRNQFNIITKLDRSVITYQRKKRLCLSFTL